MHVLELLKDSIKPFLDGKKPPMNVAEVMNLWFYFTATEQSLRGEQISFNIVQDPDLRAKMQEVINEVHRPIHKELTEFMQAEGIPLPKSTPEKPITELRDIPLGGRLTDEEVANLTSFNIVLGIQYACRGMVEAVRPDIAAMFVRFQMKKAAFAIPFRELLSQKGWLQVPPAYCPEKPQP
ncbi:DUF3231 family protein [Gorillibacterium sp. sgz5001074]|uniref:DUF3231 family protein n=1 Tax=Gorillibacterium sp. sgz5001074 TaxID=3446695 RepID=UPI003F678E9D